MQPIEKEYSDIPGTTVFDADQSRKGYGINMFCMSLLKDVNRKAFKADEAGYLKAFNLTPEQTDAVLKREWNRMLELGGNIYFTAKLGATDGLSFQQMAAKMTGSTQQEYADMMLAGGRSPNGARTKSEWKKYWPGSSQGSPPPMFPPSARRWITANRRNPTGSAFSRAMRSPRNGSRK